jgi:hypothetical protein
MMKMTSKSQSAEGLVVVGGLGLVIEGLGFGAGIGGG